MVFGKYARLPTKEPEFSDMKFDALDGPSYFSYGIQQGKYRSVYTYSSLNMKQPDVSDETKQSTTCILCYKFVTAFCYLVFLVTLPISLFFTLKVVKSFERYVIFRLGRYYKTAGAGYIIVLPCIDSLKKVDLRMKAFSVPPQKVITSDNAVLEMGAEVFYNVVDPLKSINSIQDLNHSTRIISQICLQKHISRRSLSEIESARQNLIESLREDVNDATKLWGIAVTRVELSPPKLYSKPNQLMDQTNNPLSFLGPMLFPPGSSNPPVEQLQHYFGLTGKELLQPSDVPQHQGAKQSTGGLKESIDQLIKRLSVHLNHNLVKDFDTLYKFAITSDTVNDEEYGIFFLDLKTGEGNAGSGYPFLIEPDVTLTMTKSVLLDLMSGKMSPFNAYMSGQLSVIGDLKGATKLSNLIDHFKRC